MPRTNFDVPAYVEHVYDLLGEGGTDREDVADELRKMTKRHVNMLRELHSVVDSYNQLLNSHGPFHEIELGEPVARFENILRKACNE